MSDQPRVVAGTGIAVCSVSAVAVPAATFVPTGRHIDGHDKCWSQVQAWVQLEDAARIASDPLNEALTIALTTAPTCRGGQLTCYRGRSFCEPSIPTSSDMGPPPSGSKVCGRYNYDGQIVLYLSCSSEGVDREMREDRQSIWIQSYTLQLDHLRIADFRPLIDAKQIPGDFDDLLNHVFWWTETASPDCGAQFVFSQFVAGRVASAFDGMLVPGVRGDRSTRYDNVVLFRPHDRWQDWLTEGCSPQRLRQ